jgi:CheY-like chemotaxis protein
MHHSGGEQPVILLIEEDDDTRPVLRENLVRYGYLVLLALDEEDAISRVSGGQVNADLLLINLVGKSVEDTLQTGRRIREHAKFNGATPLVVMAEKYGKDLEGTDVNVGGSDWVFYLGEELDQLQNLLRRLTSR